MGVLFLYGRSEVKDQGAPHGKLTVHCPSGVTVRLTSVTSSISFETISDEEGKAVFNRLSVGEWDVSFVDVEFALTERITIDNLDFEITMEYFKATINVTYPEGSICTVSDGITALTAPDTSGQWSVIVPRVGTWTIKAMSGSKSAIETVEITEDGQVESITVEFFTATVNVIYPEGSICTCSDGTSTLSASDTSGRYIFTVDKPGTWTISCSDGQYNKSATVNISSSGDSENVHLIYDKTPVLNVGYPANATVTHGADVTFEAVIDVAGYPTSYTYQWYVDDVAVSGCTSPIYTRSTSSDVGLYYVYCEVANAAGTVRSRTATLAVNKTPVLNVNYPEDAEVAISNSVTLETVIDTPGYPMSCRYQWYKNDSEISGATESRYTFTPDAIGATTLYCKVTNDAGTVTSRIANITTTSLHLYNKGDECTDASGGWLGKGCGVSEPVYGYDVTFRNESTSSTGYLYTIVEPGYGLLVYCAKKISLGSVNTIRSRILNNVEVSPNVPLYLVILSDLTLGTGGPVNVIASSSERRNGTSLAFDLYLDVSSFDGEYYIGFTFSVPTTTVHTGYWIHEVWLE